MYTDKARNEIVTCKLEEFIKKRLLTALLSGALILTALAGCGQGAENQSGANDASAGGESGARDELIFVNYRISGT